MIEIPCTTPRIFDSFSCKLAVTLWCAVYKERPFFSPSTEAGTPLPQNLCSCPSDISSWYEAEKYQMHPFYHSQCTGLYYLHPSTLSPEALAVNPSVFPANFCQILSKFSSYSGICFSIAIFCRDARVLVADSPTSFSFLMSTSF